MSLPRRVHMLQRRPVAPVGALAGHRPFGCAPQAVVWPRARSHGHGGLGESVARLVAALPVWRGYGACRRPVADVRKPWFCSPSSAASTSVTRFRKPGGVLHRAGQGPRRRRVPPVAHHRTVRPRGPPAGSRHHRPHGDVPGELPPVLARAHRHDRTSELAPQKAGDDAQRRGGLPTAPVGRQRHRFSRCDVIPLSSARVALVAGRVEQSGVSAVATMSRLRTAMHTLAALDLEPRELLARLHLTARRLTREQQELSDVEEPSVGCAIAVHDPVSGRLTPPGPESVRPVGGP